MNGLKIFLIMAGAQKYHLIFVLTLCPEMLNSLVMVIFGGCSTNLGFSTIQGMSRLLQELH